jgi:hypothetical protein
MLEGADKKAVDGTATLEDALEELPFSTPPIIQQALAAFDLALPRLLQERPGQWVAFHGDTLIDFAVTKLELYRKCLQQFPRGQFLVRLICPQLEEATIGLG